MRHNPATRLIPVNYPFLVALRQPIGSALRRRDREFFSFKNSRSVLECGAAAPLWNFARLRETRFASDFRVCAVGGLSKRRPNALHKVVVVVARAAQVENA
jgi:hypothetical protein